MRTRQITRRYVRPTLTVLLGAGATLGGAFLVSRLREKQEVETRMDRLEQMMEGLAGAKEAPPKKSPRKPGK